MDTFIIICANVIHTFVMTNNESPDHARDNEIQPAVVINNCTNCNNQTGSR